MKLLTGTLALFFLLTVTSSIGFGQNNDGENLNDVLIAVARSIEKSLPIKVDREKTLETVFATNETLVFKYKVTDDSNFKNPKFDNNKYLYYVNESLKTSLCANENMYELLKMGTTFNYLYINIYGEKLFENKFKINNCSQ
jgi:hypothetical protein